MVDRGGERARTRSSLLTAYRAITRTVELAGWPALALAGRRGVLSPARSGFLPAVAGGSWMHAASAGEVRGLIPLARRAAHRPLLLTAHTAAGIAAASRGVPGARVAAAPLDLPGVARRALSSAAPDALFVAETELWPNLIEAARRVEVPVALVNARISDRTIGRYRALRGLVAPLLSSLRAIAAQSEVDAERFLSLGAGPEAVRVTGNMKHDVPAAEAVPPELPWGGAPVVVAGSLRSGEEEVVAAALQLVATRVPFLRIVAAPRHLQRRSNVGRAFHARGFRVGFRSEGGPSAGESVLVLDTMGELAGFYAVARVAIVGGTLLPFGGHNVVEPAARGVPVVHGPFVANCRVEAEALARLGGSTVANTIDSLAAAVERLLCDDLVHRQAAAAARRAVMELSGATDRTIAFLAERGVWPA